MTATAVIARNPTIPTASSRRVQVQASVVGVRRDVEAENQEQPRLRPLRRGQEPGIPGPHGLGRRPYFVIEERAIKSFAGLTANPPFTLTFKDAAKGFAILSAKDSQAAFLRGLGSNAFSGAWAATT